MPTWPLPTSGKTPYVHTPQPGASTGFLNQWYQQNVKLNAVMDLRADFGGAPDLDVDSTQALLDAFEYAESNPGMVLYSPRGPEPYRIREANLEIPGNFAWIGDGRMSRIIGDYTGYQQAMFRNDWSNGSANLVLKDICFDRSGPGTDHGLLFNGLTNPVFDGLSIIGEGPRAGTQASGALAISAIGPDIEGRIVSTNVSITRLYIEHANNFGAQLGTIDGAIIDDYIIEGLRELIGLEPENGETCKGVVIGNGFLRGEASGVGSATGLLVVTATSGGTVEDWLIDGAKVLGAGPAIAQPGIGIYGTTDGQLVNFSSRFCGLSGVHLGSAAAGAGVANLRISNGEILDNNQTDAADEFGIHLRGGGTVDNLIEHVRIKGSNHRAGVGETSGATRNVVRLSDLGGNQAPTSMALNTSRAYANRNTVGDPDIDYFRLGPRAGLKALTVSGITSGANVPICELISPIDSATNYGGLVTVQARSSSTSGANTATYVLLVGKHGAGSSVDLIASNGLDAGASASHPSFTFSIDTVNNHLEITPIGATSGSTFQFLLIAHGDLLISPL